MLIQTACRYSSHIHIFIFSNIQSIYSLTREKLSGNFRAHEKGHENAHEDTPISSLLNTNGPAESGEHTVVPFLLINWTHKVLLSWISRVIVVPVRNYGDYIVRLTVSAVSQLGTNYDTMFFNFRMMYTVCRGQNEMIWNDGATTTVSKTIKDTKLDAEIGLVLILHHRKYGAR